MLSEERADGNDDNSSERARHDSAGRTPHRAADGPDQLRGSLRALGTRQLARQRDRLHRGRAPVAGGPPPAVAGGGAGRCSALLFGRGGPSPTPPTPAPRRPAPPPKESPHN